MEYVVLLNKKKEPIGTLPKAMVHDIITPFHLACSIFLKHKQTGQILLQQRSPNHPFAPGMWAGSACGHPLPGESLETAIRRVVQRELGIEKIENLTLVLPDFSYRCMYQGIRENELCPTFVGVIHEEPKPNPTEVAQTAWIDANFLVELKQPLAYWTQKQLKTPELQKALKI